MQANKFGRGDDHGCTPGGVNRYLPIYLCLSRGKSNRWRQIQTGRVVVGAGHGRGDDIEACPGSKRRLGYLLARRYLIVYLDCHTRKA